MRALLVLLFVSSCGGSDVPEEPITNWCGTDQNWCNDTCGNGQVEMCNRTRNSSCYPIPSMEVCDPGITITCESRGFYGGTVSCTSDCRSLDSSACDVCAPTSTCASYTSLGTVGKLVPSGARIALVARNGFAIYEGLTEITRVTLPNITDIVPVADGWLLATTSALSKVSLDGVRGPEQPFVSGRLRLAAGPSGRVIVAWAAEMAGLTHARSAIVDGDGTELVPAVDHGLITQMSDVSATSDGTSFFVGASGKLFRIAADATITTTTGFPTETGEWPVLAWGGGTGWYVRGDIAQRFDANGTLVGDPISIAATAFFAEADALRIVSDHTHKSVTRFSLLRVTSTGADASFRTEVGSRSSSSGVAAAPIAGGQVLVAWDIEPKLELALVTP